MSLLLFLLYLMFMWDNINKDDDDCGDERFDPMDDMGGGW